MSTKEAFERAWFAQFPSNADDTSPALPTLSCWDSTGNLRSQDALRDELDRCKRRIAELKRNLRAEEFIEFFCQRQLKCQSGGWPRTVAKRTASLPFRGSSAGTSESPETAVRVEGIYSEPVDSRQPQNIYHNCEPPRSPEGLYSEPVDAKGLHRIPSVPETVYAVPVAAKPVTAPRRMQNRVYEEINDVRAEKADAGDNSSDDESVENLVAIRQSVSRLSQWCVDGEAARKRLEMQAQHLSSRFSCYAFPATGSGMRNNGLESVQESLVSPTTPSGTVLRDVHLL